MKTPEIFGIYQINPKWGRWGNAYEVQKCRKLNFAFKSGLNFLAMDGNHNFQSPFDLL